ncbi:alanine racemase [Spirillospora sp. NBC_01491]|uniref:alanine racemase n=1 Tax=Spirillospora sp. NBC_01491 TaxID=2976007 RepID=UPI002E30413F|nr:alanine racemase [Spirillospora sp. NBC_01491]
MWQAARADRGRQTPFLAVDHPRLIGNIRDMAGRVARRGGASTPHLKTHKNLQIARAQVAAGATAATVATVAEAHLAFDAGFESVLFAYPPFPGGRLRALPELAERGRVAVTCHSAEQVALLAGLGGAYDVYWEVDSGTGRLGTAPGEPTAAAAASARFGDRVRLRGLMTFAGHAYGARAPEELVAVRDQQDRALFDSRAALASRGIDVPVRSVGVTPLAPVDSGEAEEYRYGNYVFYDATQVALAETAPGGPGLDDCALAVISTVVDAPSEGRLVLDAGAKSLPAEKMTSLSSGFGAVAGHPDIVIDKLYEEHGLASRGAGSRDLKPGDRVAVIPNHACTAVNLFHQYAVYDASSFVETWPIQARRR